MRPKWAIKYDENDNPLYLYCLNDKTFKPIYFIEESKLKDPKYNLYCFVNVENEKLYLKFGEAQKQSVYDRYKNITTSTAYKRMICVWESDKRDKPILSRMDESAKNKLGFVKSSKQNTDEGYEIIKVSGYRNFFTNLNQFIGETPYMGKVDCPPYEDIIRLVKSMNFVQYTKFLLDLPPRWGKTRTVLEIGLLINSRIIVTSAYVFTVSTSYKDNINKYSNYNRFLYVNPDEFKSAEEVISVCKKWLDADPDNKIFFYLSLTGTFNYDTEEYQECDNSTFTRRTKALYSLKDYGISIFVEEVDFGAWCKRQAEKIRTLYRDLDCRYYFGTTGTNAERSEYIFKCDCYIKRDYLMDILCGENTGRKNPTKIRWYILNNSDFLETGLAESYEMENFSDMFTVNGANLRGQAYLKSLVKFLFDTENFAGDSTKIRRIANNKYEFFNDDACTMFFTPVGYLQHELFKKIVESVVSSDKYLVKIIDGNYTSNMDAEEYAKQAIKDANLEGKKVIFIASNMANRSFSIPEIKNIVLLLNEGSYSSIYQKISRGLTPHDSFDTCFILDFRLGNSSDKDTCASKYLSGLGCDVLDDNTTKNSSDRALDIPQLISHSHGKIIFRELFSGEGIPFRELSEDELYMMMNTSTFQKKRGLMILKEFDSRVREPRQCDLNEKISEVFKSGNHKGDSDKYERGTSKGNSKRSSVEAKKEREIMNKKLQYGCFILNHKSYFLSSYKFEKNVWLNELNDIKTSDRKKAFEETFNLDMDTISDIIDVLVEKKVLTDNDVIRYQI